MERYNYFSDNGNLMAVDTVTGEKFEAHNINVVAGSKVITPAQREAQMNYRRRGERMLSRTSEHFFFILREHQLNKISAATAGRLIYLCTFLGYDKYLMLSERQAMKRYDLAKVLNVSKRTADSFWKEISPNYIIQKNGKLVLACEEITRGGLADKKSIYQKFFVNAIRNLYDSVNVTKHKYLGYIYQMLPYINVEFNILCKNPLEKNIDMICPLSLSEFCESIGYDKSNAARLMKLYSSIIFDVGDHKEYFTTFAMNKTSAKNIKIFVNPHILYAGSNLDQVKVLGAFAKC